MDGATMRVGIMQAVVLALLYLAFVGQIASDEIGLALGCGSLTALWAAALRHRRKSRFHFTPPMAGALARAVADCPRAWASVARAQLIRRTGSISHHELKRGRDTAKENARRATALIALSLAPDRYVLQWPEERDEAEFHVLSFSPQKVDRQWGT